MTRRALVANLLTYAALGAFALFSLGPMLWMFVTSLKPDAEIVKVGIDYWPRHPTLSNYADVWRQSAYPILVSHSVVVTALTALVCVLLGTPAAFVLSRLRFRGKQKLLLVLIATRMLPLVMIVAPLFSILRALGLIDSMFGLALAYSGILLPLYIWLLKSFFDSVPTDVVDAAELDGASPFLAMTKITIPLSMQGFLATIFFSAIAAWNELLFALMLTSTQASRTWPVGLQMMVGNFQLPYGALAAAGVLSIAPVVLLLVLGRRVLASVVVIEARDR